MIKRVLAILIILFASLTVSGCTFAFPEKYPIEDVQNILVAGIDIEDGTIVMTVVVDTLEQGATANEQKKGTQIYQAEGKTIFEAKRKLHEFTEKRVTWNHLKYIVIGEDAAKAGIDQCLNYFCENHETKLLADLLVAKETTAQDLFEQISSGEESLPDHLDSLFNELARTAKAYEVRLLDYATVRERTWVDLYIPTLQIEEIEQKSDSSSQSQQSETEQPSYIAKLEGYALFQDDSLAGYVDGDAAKDINFVINGIDNTIVTIQDMDDRYTGLEVIQSTADITPDFDTLSVTVSISVMANLAEYSESIILPNEEFIVYLENKQSQLLRENVQQTLEALQKEKTDIVGFGDAFYHSDPEKFSEMEDNWQQIFSDLKITVQVETKIDRTYSLTNALGS